MKQSLLALILSRKTIIFVFVSALLSTLAQLGKIDGNTAAILIAGLAGVLKVTIAAEDVAMKLNSKSVTLLSPIPSSSDSLTPKN